MQKGSVKWFSDEKGYGFIHSDNKDIFVHYKDVVGEGFRTLKQGDKVEFTAEKSPKGLVAKSVMLLAAFDS